MAFTTAKFILPGRRGDVGRAAAELANAAMLNTLSYVASDAGNATGTTTSKVKFANNITYLVNGQFYAKNATDDFWTLSGTVVAASRFQKYALLIDTSGNASIQEATQAAGSADNVVWTNVSGLSRWAPYFTMLGQTKALVGVLTVATNASTTFTPGTTLLGAAGITATYIDGLDQSLVPLIADAAGTIIGNGG